MNLVYYLLHHLTHLELNLLRDVFYLPYASF
nr:MAG TPA: O-GlcNAcase [Caudoviricetes sp.]